MQRSSVHFATTQTFFLWLTPGNQRFCFWKYSKCAKTNISLKYVFKREYAAQRPKEVAYSRAPLTGNELTFDG